MVPRGDFPPRLGPSTGTDIAEPSGYFGTVRLTLLLAAALVTVTACGTSVTASGTEPGLGDWSLTVTQRGDKFCEDFSTPTGSGGGCARLSDWLVPHRLSPTVGLAGGTDATLASGEVSGLASE